MYARFLEQAASIADQLLYLKAARHFRVSARRFTSMAHLFQDAQTAPDLDQKIQSASAEFRTLAGIEEKAWRLLESA